MATVTVLYKVVNDEADNADSCFNAFTMPREAKGPTLASVKQNCMALRGLSHLGPEGFHWRVCVEDKPAPGEEVSSRGAYTWWDIQDENAVLPVKEASASQLAKFFSPPKIDNSDPNVKAARGAAKNMFKAVAGVVGGGDDSSGPLIPVVAFKLLDLVKMDDDFRLKNPGKMGGNFMMDQQQQLPVQTGETPVPGGRRVSFFRSSLMMASFRAHHRHAPAPAAVATPGYNPPPHRPTTAPAPQPSPASAPQGNLMDFSPAVNPRNLVHTSSSPAAFAADDNVSRAEKLQREYQQKQTSSELVWDPVEERMVHKDSMKNGSVQGTDSDAPKAKIVGTSLDASSTIGKSAHVAQAVTQRINDMKQSQDKALSELREREAKAAKDKDEEDEVRKRLEPKIKAWSEEHGKKKQLRALLGTLHTILWPDSGWKQVSIGDILDDAKVKKVYFKASRIVHPDKAGSLDPEKRFLAKRIFDALTQAKVDFDAGKK